MRGIPIHRALTSLVCLAAVGSAAVDSAAAQESAPDTAQATPEHAGQEQAAPNGSAPKWDWEAAQKARTAGRRHEGLMLRLTAGPAFMWIEQSANFFVLNGDDPFEAASARGGGFGAAVALDAGWGLNEELSLHLRFAVTHSSADDEFADRGLSLTGWLLGPALTFHLMPLNAYGTLAVGVTQASFNTGGAEVDSATSALGYGLSLDVGKEWWIHPELGLGFALRWTLTSTTTDLRAQGAAAEADLKTWGGALLLSTTWQ